MVATEQSRLATSYLNNVFGQSFTTRILTDQHLEQYVWIRKNWAEIQDEVLEMKKLVEDACERGE